MIAPDTNIWIAFLRDADTRIAGEMRRLLLRREILLLGPVRVELFAGASKAAALRLAKLFRPLPTVYPVVATWQQAEAWAIQGARASSTFGLADLLIGTLTAEHAARLWTADGDFKRMAALGLLQLHVLP